MPWLNMHADTRPAAVNEELGRLALGTERLADVAKESYRVWASVERHNRGLAPAEWANNEWEAVEE